MASLLPSKIADREELTGDEATGDEARIRQLDLRRTVLGLGALAGGYVVGRRLLRGRAPSAGALRERAGEAMPGDGVDVPIVGRSGPDEGTSSEGASSEESVSETGGGEEPAPGADPSLEEIDERTGSDVKESPAEPGEMQVDEDVLDEAVDDGDETEE